MPAATQAYLSLNIKMAATHKTRAPFSWFFILVLVVNQMYKIRAFPGDMNDINWVRHKLKVLLI
jgi:hypothetical protein